MPGLKSSYESVEWVFESKKSFAWSNKDCCISSNNVEKQPFKLSIVILFLGIYGFAPNELQRFKWNH